ncbi:A/G-specific adenine glycosylase [Demequina capsici]|uniref:Adenine DNA glycosylase n=1 Tax=Demequina capsici TaxID=3075620 RepID=A0AA96JA68_9MICO|nr:A/G-specific adenine glycosylase [Demequina sp. PMTSA13]WNM27120.1 A/G-specific adenine glycosylase [Demequina sp. PMTSA13]
MPTTPQAHRDRRIVEQITTWFAREARDLPWRRADCSPWGVLVSEVMLQQTPVVRVEPVWHEWMRRWPSPADLAGADQADAVRAWGRLGYPRRAKRLWECARALVEHHGGEVPSDEERLLALPGIGAYTAAAVAAFAYGQRSVVLDTNVRRVIGRAWEARALPPLHQTVGERERAAALVPHDATAAVRWAAGSMELGALVCTARAPRCDECPIAADCAWLAAGAQGLDAAPRRVQPWHGTDRQVRGRIMALLRAAHAPVTVGGHASLEDIEPGQLDSCLDSLVDDGLVRPVDAQRGTYAL